MNGTSRRTFMKAGISTGAALAGVSAGVGKSFAGTKTLSGSFSILGLDGTIKLEVEGSIAEGISFDVSVDTISAHKACARIRLNPNGTMAVKRFSIEMAVPLKDVQRIWYTQQLDGLGWRAYIGLPWGAEIPAAGHDGSLLSGVHSRHGKNRCLIALKNQSGDGSLGFRTAYGGKYIYLAVNRFAQDRTYSVREIDETLYVDREDIPIHEAVSRFVEWYDREWKPTITTPRACFEPVWNTWYPSLGNINDDFIARNARICAELGFKTFIIDSGWMKADGCWEPKTEAFPDFGKTIADIQSLGLRVIIWYRPFYYAGNAPDSDEMAPFRVVTGGKPTDLLCPRCTAVRDRAGRIAEKLMRDYGLDGLKIDFLDASPASAPLVKCEADHEHAHDFVSDGVRETMRVMAESIRKVKPDAIIEYRLNYANVANRPFGNCYRGQDTPSDPDLGRRHLTLIRSWSRGVAPHSDPSFWTSEESDENVARYLATIFLYAVPTLSINFSDLPKSHVSLIRAWLQFYHEHKAKLMNGLFEPLSDDFHYSAARISSSGNTYIPVFLREWPSVISVVPEHTDTMYLFNGTAGQRIITRLAGAEGTYRLSTTDVFLKPIDTDVRIKSMNQSLQLDYPVDIGGMVCLKRV
ncbi:hypothetical protein LLG96_05865 [bacterium]|nr:hypothetical protein [bacterium]